VSKIEELIGILQQEPQVYIQTHDYPDHDSVGAAYGLRYLLRRRGINAHLVYEGSIQRDSVALLVGEVRIPLRHAAEVTLQPADKIIIVDGCKGNSNVTDLAGEEIAVIDHHAVGSCEQVPFMDIRPGYGSCSTIIFTYFQDLGLEVPPSAATALLIGLLVDTALMTRRVSREDLVAYSSLYVAADIHFVNMVLRNKIQRKDLSFYRKALDHVRIQDRFAFYFFREGCNPNLLGIIGDFFLSLREVNFVVLCARNDGNINFSARSEDRHWNAAQIIQELLRGIGFGGGHADMAGGIITDPQLFDEEALVQRLSRILKRTQPSR
jgi:nanoRNase/pAp phosphatase (c-di-AMP/oligoRNAs hydrolase)